LSEISILTTVLAEDKQFILMKSIAYKEILSCKDNTTRLKIKQLNEFYSSKCMDEGLRGGRQAQDVWCQELSTPTQ